MNRLSQLIFVGAVVAAIAGGVFFALRPFPSGEEIEIHPPGFQEETSSDLSVYVSGAVRAPGVYSLKSGTRLLDLIEAAGGAVGEADLSAVNLAVKLRDEDHWHVPLVGEAPAPGTSGNGAVDINTASKEQLMALPGVGEVKAQSILDYIESNGPFGSVEELLAVSGIGPATLVVQRFCIDG